MLPLVYDWLNRNIAEFNWLGWLFLMDRRPYMPVNRAKALKGWREGAQVSWPNWQN